MEGIVLYLTGNPLITRNDNKTEERRIIQIKQQQKCVLEVLLLGQQSNSRHLGEGQGERVYSTLIERDNGHVLRTAKGDKRETMSVQREEEEENRK